MDKSISNSCNPIFITIYLISTLLLLLLLFYPYFIHTYIASLTPIVTRHATLLQLAMYVAI